MTTKWTTTGDQRVGGSSLQVGELLLDLLERQDAPHATAVSPFRDVACRRGVRMRWHAAVPLWQPFLPGRPVNSADSSSRLPTRHVSISATIALVSRVFLSHSSRDNRQAVAVKQWLIEHEPGLPQAGGCRRVPASAIGKSCSDRQVRSFSESSCAVMKLQRGKPIAIPCSPTLNVPQTRQRASKNTPYGSAKCRRRSMAYKA